MKKLIFLLSFAVVLVLGTAFSACGGGSVVRLPDEGSEIFPPDPGSDVSTDFGEAEFTPAQASGWSTETVDAAGNIGWQTSIDVGVPHSAPANPDLVL